MSETRIQNWHCMALAEGSGRWTALKSSFWPRRLVLVFARSLRRIKWFFDAGSAALALRSYSRAALWLPLR